MAELEICADIYLSNRPYSPASVTILDARQNVSIPSTGLSDDERLVVSPRRAKHLLDCGNTRLYELLNSEELESYLDGRSRKITVSSIKAHIARRLAAGANHHTSAVAAARKRANHVSKNQLASNIADETI